MIRYDLVPLPHFQRDLKRIKRKHIKLNDLDTVFEMLHLRTKDNLRTLKTRYKDHPLRGNNRGYRELHLAPNILLKYQIHKDVLVLVLVKLGSHKYVLK